MSFCHFPVNAAQPGSLTHCRGWSMKPVKNMRKVLWLLACLGATSALALPSEKDPLRSRVPLEKREIYRNLSSPLYNDSKSVPPHIIEAGQKIYERVCANCHGESGNGVGPTAAFLPIKPRDFTNCKFQRKRSDGELFYVIKFGSWPMPPMISLITEEEAWEVVAYIRTFCG